MKIPSLKTLAIIVAAITCAHNAQAGTWSLGASALLTPGPYRGYQDRVYPVPIINYEGDDFYFRSLMAGYNLWRDQQNQLSVIVLYSPLNFKPGDSDDDRMKQLDKRRSTLMGGMAYSYNADWGTIRSTLVGDVLNNSNGLVGDVAYLYRFQTGDWRIIPALGMTWNSSNQNKYYFGINGNESRRSGFNSYTPSGSVSPYLELTTQYQINTNWNAFFTGRYTSLASEIKDSPMVDKSYSGMLWTGVTYRF
ncbi:MltA-interacting protein MipA [Serratia sp. S1B]|nr:MltA-interacting protein MipA [Serratia sp. S1B]